MEEADGSPEREPAAGPSATTDEGVEQAQETDPSTSWGASEQSPDDVPALDHEASPGGAEDGGDVAGTIAPETPVEPGDLELRNALFVVLGGYFGVLAIAAFVGGGGGLSVPDTALVTVGYATLAVVVYGLLVRANPDT